MSVVMFLVPHLSGGGAEKAIADVASAVADVHSVYLVTTLPETGEKRYPVSGSVRYLNLHEWAAAIARDGRLRDLFPWSSLSARLRGLLSGSGFSRIIPGEDQLTKQTRALKALKKELGVSCSVSFLDSANYLNVRSCVGERTVVSIRSYPKGLFAPPSCRTEEGMRRIRAACAEADCVVPVSQEIGALLREEFGVPPERIRVIGNFVDTERIAALAALPADARSAGASEDGTFTFVSVGRLTAKKGQWHLLRAFRMVAGERPDARLVLLGRPGKGTDDVSGLLGECIRSMDLEGRVFLRGFFDNPYAVMARCGAYVSASFNEGFPNSLTEAMALGLPVISTDCSSGPREILAPGSGSGGRACGVEYAPYGILTPVCSGSMEISRPPEPAELCLRDAMLRIMDDGQLWRRYGELGRKRAEELSAGEALRRWKEAIGGGEGTACMHGERE